MLRNQDGVGFRSGPGASGDESTSFHNSVEPASVDHEIFNDRESADAERLDCDRGAVAKFSHVKLAHSAGMIGTVSFAIDRERARAANAFAAIGVKGNRFLASIKQLFVEDVEHFEKRRVRRDIADLVIDKFAGGLAVLLTPDSQRKVHS